MHQAAAPRTTIRQALGSGAIVLAVVSTAIMVALGCQSASSSAPSFSAMRSPDTHRIVLQPKPSPAPSSNEVRATDHGRATPEDDGPITEDDGLLPDGVTVFDDEYPGVGNLSGDLREALREAAAEAADDGVQLDVTSGWRSPAYQDQLLREAVAEYGSQAAAARWVATAGTSLHVTGNAVDIGPLDATAWLSKRGAAYGLCPVYRNEPWHYELRPRAIDRECPAMYADPSRDPRLHP